MRSPRQPPRPQRSTFAVGVAAWSYLGWVIGLVLAYRIRIATGGAEGVDVAQFLDTAVFSLAWAGFPAFGALLAVRRPGNCVGWMLLLVGFSFYGFEPVTGWTELVAARGGRPVMPLLWATAVVNALAVLPVLAFAHVLLGFPDGLTTRWSRVLSWIALVATALVTVVRLLRPGRLDLAVAVNNPFGLASMADAGEVLVAPRDRHGRGGHAARVDTTRTPSARRRPGRAQAAAVGARLRRDLPRRLGARQRPGGRQLPGGPVHHGRGVRPRPPRQPHADLRPADRCAGADLPGTRAGPRRPRPGVDVFGRSLRDEVSRDAVVDALRTTTIRTFEPTSVGVVLLGAAGKART